MNPCFQVLVRQVLVWIVLIWDLAKKEFGSYLRLRFTGHPHHDGVGLEPGLVKLSVRFSLSFVESTAFPVSGFTGPVRLPEKLTSEVEWYLKQGFYSPKPNSTVQVVQAKPGDFAVWDQNQTVPHFAPSGRPRLIASVSEVITRKEAARRFRGVRGVNLVEYSALSIPNNWSSRQVIGKAACL